MASENINLQQQNGNTSQFKRLLRDGTNINACLDNGTPLLHVAAGKGDAAMCELLIEHGANIRAKDKEFGTTALHVPAKDGKAEICDLLLTHGARPDAKDKAGHTPLHMAAILGHVDAGDDEVGLTPLHMAAMEGHTAMCRLLIMDGAADIHAKDKHGHTPLDLSTKHDVCRLLTEWG